MHEKAIIPKNKPVAGHLSRSRDLTKITFTQNFIAKSKKGTNRNWNDQSAGITGTGLELLNMTNIRKSYDSRNVRTNSAVEKLRMGTNSGTSHYQHLNNKFMRDSRGLRLSSEKQLKRKGKGRLVLKH